jgi:hypothetical protein
VLVLFLNSIDALHGVSVRSTTNVPRYFLNLVAEVREPLFDLKGYQEKPPLATRIASLPGRALRRARRLVAS